MEKISQWLIDLGWKFWLFLLIIILFIIWFIFGGEPQQFIGLEPIYNNKSSNNSKNDNEGDFSSIGSSPSSSIYRSYINSPQTEIDDNHRSYINSPQTDLIDNYQLEVKQLTPKFYNYTPKITSNYKSIETQKLISSPIKNFPKLKIFDFEKSDNKEILKYKPTVSNPKLIPKITSRLENIFALNHKNMQESDLLMGGNKKRNKSESIGERICRQSLEKIYGKEFPNKRPDFLKNPETGYNLELDGYNEELQIGFEYNGIQHYIFPNWIHKSNEEFLNQVRRDIYKLEACDRAGIYIITIPYEIPHNMIYDYIVYYLPENVQRRMDESNK